MKRIDMHSLANVVGLTLMCVQTCYPDAPTHVAEVTAYTASSDECAPWPGTHTATGQRADWRSRLVAVDPRVVPLGSWVWIEHLGWLTAADTGGAIKGTRIDVLMRDKRTARRWGRQRVRVFVSG